MKKIGLLIVMFVSLISCSNDDSSDNAKLAVTDYHGKWINIHEVKDINSPYLWTEYYVFNANNTFVKSRTTIDGTTTATGTFEVFTADNRPNFKLTYSAATNLIYNCTSGVGGTSELLYIYNGYLENSARMCDAASTYEKEK
ncbi:hypothetical protein [Flavobacterium sp. S87F.05.LMB.W.Kidney.N]|uniref:hypothetical protein n=1 Tax=Flavobacterium sp. S87F.05.LMB.W.Kidney.N TaxID=1278758 RepID=UPI001066648E|nr:hypothetical protein [Flavobacterium sp. S87F.05.LMB.W.Kidney.N]TDX10402.1 hypothetical protein EDB96_2808 [Flavobacterium sp. S87F.05.LMB.W.Kidney.N]